MKTISSVFLCLLSGAGILTMSSVGASAAIACSRDVCWHVQKTYHYPPTAHVVIHPEGWHWGPKIVIRDHSGRGYWRGDHWVEW